MPFFSIITVCYNAASCIEKTIKSVINQTETDFEYIVIDGMSTDGTIEKIEKYKARIACLVSEKDNGIYNAMNKGIKSAKGKYIGLINAGDWYEEDALKKVREMLINSPTDVVGITGMVRTIENGAGIKVIGTSFDCLPYITIQHPATFLQKEIYDKYGLYNETYRSASDYDYFIKLKMQNLKIIFCEHVLANFSGGGISQSKIGKTETLKIQLTHRLISWIRFLLGYIKIFLFDSK